MILDLCIAPTSGCPPAEPPLRPFWRGELPRRKPLSVWERFQDIWEKSFGGSNCVEQKGGSTFSERKETKSGKEPLEKRDEIKL